MFWRVDISLRLKKRLACYALAGSGVLLSACAPTLVSQTQQLPAAPRPMQRVVVVLNDDVYSRFLVHDSAMSYIQDLRDAIQTQFEQKGISVQTVETNATSLSNNVAQAVIQMKPTHILRLFVVQTSKSNRSISPDRANWMFDVEQEDVDALTTINGPLGAKRLHRFRSIYRAEYDAPACVPLIRLPNQQQACTNKLVSQFIDDTHRVGLSN